MRKLFFVFRVISATPPFSNGGAGGVAEAADLPGSAEAADLPGSAEAAIFDPASSGLKPAAKRPATFSRHPMDLLEVETGTGAKTLGHATADLREVTARASIAAADLEKQLRMQLSLLESLQAQSIGARAALESKVTELGDVAASFMSTETAEQHEADMAYVGAEIRSTRRRVEEIENHLEALASISSTWSRTTLASHDAADNTRTSEGPSWSLVEVSQHIAGEMGQGKQLKAREGRSLRGSAAGSFLVSSDEEGFALPVPTEPPLPETPRELKKLAEELTARVEELKKSKAACCDDPFTGWDRTCSTTWCPPFGSNEFRNWVLCRCIWDGNSDANQNHHCYKTQLTGGNFCPMVADADGGSTRLPNCQELNSRGISYAMNYDGNGFKACTRDQCCYTGTTIFGTGIPDHPPPDVSELKKRVEKLKTRVEELKKENAALKVAHKTPGEAPEPPHVAGEDVSELKKRVEKLKTRVEELKEAYAGCCGDPFTERVNGESVRMCQGTWCPTHQGSNELEFRNWVLCRCIWDGNSDANQKHHCYKTQLNGFNYCPTVLTADKKRTTFPKCQELNSLGVSYAMDYEDGTKGFKPCTRDHCCYPKNGPLTITGTERAQHFGTGTPDHPPPDDS